MKFIWITPFDSDLWGYIDGDDEYLQCRILTQLVQLVIVENFDLFVEKILELSPGLHFENVASIMQKHRHVYKKILKVQSFDKFFFKLFNKVA